MQDDFEAFFNLPMWELIHALEDAQHATDVRTSDPYTREWSTTMDEQTTRKTARTSADNMASNVSQNISTKVPEHGRKYEENQGGKNTIRAGQARDCWGRKADAANRSSGRNIFVKPCTGGTSGIPGKMQLAGGSSSSIYVQELQSYCWLHCRCSLDGCQCRGNGQWVGFSVKS